VREDPESKGLLFAGTERSVYVSFDDGDHWQSLKQNLPPTSIRDLVIHGDDIVVGTHGRSFWILDNITPLRQLGKQPQGSSDFLFQPRLTYRVRRNNNTDTPLPPEEPAGQNPPDGAMIDYRLDSHAAHVFLSVEDSSGKTVRTFSSTDKPELVNAKELNVPTYWVRPLRVLSDAPGMHRFIWDLHYPEPDVLEHEYPISAIYHDTPRYPLGAAVLPGKYRLVLRTDRGITAQVIEISMDPRVKTSEADLRRQFELDRKIADALHRDYQAVMRLRSIRAQIKDLSAKHPDSAIAKLLNDLEEKAAALEGEEGGFGAHYLSTPQGRSLAALNSALSAILSEVDSADAAPTTQQTAMFGEVEVALKDQLQAWDRLRSIDVAEANAKLRPAGLPEIDLAKPASPSAEGGQTTSQDRDKNEE